MPTRTEPRPLWMIADDIASAWEKPYFGAIPYIEAMRCLENMASSYEADDARTIVLYFLANATTWRGPAAREIKAELKAML